MRNFTEEEKATAKRVAAIRTMDRIHDKATQMRQDDPELTCDAITNMDADHLHAFATLLNSTDDASLQAWLNAQYFQMARDSVAAVTPAEVLHDWA